MVESWRKKRYYTPRITIPVSIMTETELTGKLVCLSGPQLAILLSLLGYADRRITWVSTYYDDYYLTPTNEEWDTIQALIADLEDTLMSDCVTPLVEALEGINTTLASLVTAMGPMEAELTSIAGNVGDLLGPLQCICAKDTNLSITNVISPDWPDYPDAEKVFGWGTELPVATIPALVDEEACALAQCVYQAGFELVTEVFLPIFGAGYGDLLPAAAAAIAVFTGGVTLPIVIGVYALTDLLQELGEIAWEAAEANLINWMFTHKQDIVCELYNNIKVGGTGTQIWQSVADDIVAPAVDLSAGDKVLVNFWFGIIGNYAARIAQTLNSTWYQSVPEAGFCEACEEPPTIGSDWVAVPVSEEQGEISLEHPAGSYWTVACFEHAAPAGFTVVGLLVEVVSASGTCEYKWMNGVTEGCSGTVSFTPNTSDQMTVSGWYYQHDEFTHDNDEVVATLAPGATQFAHAVQVTGPVDMCQAFKMGWNCTGSVTAFVRYVVYAGTTPP